MGLLTVCAQHYEGLAWLGAFYALLCYTPHLYRLCNPHGRGESTPLRHSPLQETLFVGFVSSMLYVGGTLPCGRFYYENVDGFFGNSFLRLSYEYLYLHLGVGAHLVDRLERWLLARPGQAQLEVAAAAQLVVQPQPTPTAEAPQVATASEDVPTTPASAPDQPAQAGETALAAPTTPTAAETLLDGTAEAASLREGGVTKEGLVEGEGAVGVDV